MRASFETALISVYGALFSSVDAGSVRFVRLRPMRLGPALSPKAVLFKFSAPVRPDVRFAAMLARTVAAVAESPILVRWPQKHRRLVRLELSLKISFRAE